MQNLLIKHCRIECGLTPSKIAAKLGIDVPTFKAIESADFLMTAEQAMQMGNILNVKSEYLYESAIYLDLLRTKIAVIKVLEFKIMELKEQLKQDEEE